MRHWFFLSSLFLFACGDSGTKPVVQSTENPIASEPVLLEVSVAWPITLQQDSLRLLRHTDNSICQGAIAQEIIQTDTYHFRMRNGKLFLWETMECTARRYGGGHVDLLNEWNFDGAFALPDSLIPHPACQEISHSILLNSTLLISSNRMVEILQFPDFCLTEDLILDPTFANYKGAVASVQDCRTLLLTLGDKRATLTFNNYDMLYNGYTAEFKYEDHASCNIIKWGEEPATDSLCAHRAGLDLLQTPDVLAHNCIAATGFLDP